MEYRPVTGVWEVTMGCNMRCKHCGSSCTHPLPDELTTAEALDLCDQIADLGLHWITLSGGEPLTRPDWPQLVRRLREKGVIPNMITNAWLCDEAAIATARENGIGTMAISFDGPEDVHDFMRRPDSFRRCAEAFQTMSRYGVTSGAITTVSRKNIERLAEIKEILIGLGVRYWQMQIGLPMGNLKHNEYMVMHPEDVDHIIDFTYQHVDDNRIFVYPADCLGYYNQKESKIRQKISTSSSPSLWRGCNAGKRSLGILHNGDILGCTSIRDREFIEGNIRQRPLREIWEDKNSFRWSRGMRKSDLAGECRTCQYGEDCLGGCPNTRLTMKKSIYSENEYCSYNVALKKADSLLAPIADSATLLSTARSLASRGETQLAAKALERLLAKDADNLEGLLLFGFLSFSLGNFSDCRMANEQAIVLSPDNPYAHKGLGLALHRLDETEQGLEHLHKAAALSGPDDMDAYHDLAVICLETGRQAEAREVLDRARQMTPAFAHVNPHLYMAAQIIAPPPVHAQA